MLRDWSMDYRSLGYKARLKSAQSIPIPMGYSILQERRGRVLVGFGRDENIIFAARAKGGVVGGGMRLGGDEGNEGEEDG